MVDYSCKMKSLRAKVSNNVALFSGIFLPDFTRLTKKHCLLAMFPEGRQTRKHCILAMFAEGGQTRKHCLLAMFPEGRQTRKHCFLAMFAEGGQTRKHCFLAIFPEGEGQSVQIYLTPIVCSALFIPRKHLCLQYFNTRCI